MPSTDTPKIQPTSAAEWKSKKDAGFIVELPSGNFARVRRTLDMMVMLRTGKIPNPLAAVVRGMIQKGESEFPTDQMNEETLTQMLDLLDNNAANVMLEPKVEVPPKRKVGEDDDSYNARFDEWKPSDGAISSWDLEVNDKLYLMSVGQGQVVDLRSFRAEQERVVADLPASKAVSRPAKRTARSSKR